MGITIVCAHAFSEMSVIPTRMVRVASDIIKIALDFSV